MPKPQKSHPWEDRFYVNGANRDLEDELLSAENGTYLDAQNMRTGSMDGDNAAIKKIDGEEIVYPNKDNRCSATTTLNQPLSGSYKCIGEVEVKNKKIEFWADKEEVEDPLIRIDGKIVLKSPDFPIDAKHPLQIHKNESCIGGEIYISDFNNPVMIFNIEDLLKNSGESGGTCSEKYFSDFNINNFIAALDQPADHPVFVSIVDKGAGGGLPTGQYQYGIRFANQAGDRTQWSVSTPLIPVVAVLQSLSSLHTNQYPGIKTYSTDPSLTKTNYAPKIRFRVINFANFDFLEIRRISYKGDSKIGTLPIVEVIERIDIDNGEISVKDFTDNGNITPLETITDIDSTEVMSSVRRAKAVRYFNQRLYLMNVEFESRDIEGKFTFKEINNKKMFPTIQKLGKLGHVDPYNHTYFSSYPSGEKHGYGVVFFDNNGERTFAAPVTGHENDLYPNRREEISQETDDTSYFGTVKAATIYGEVKQTHEVFDLTDAVAKTEKCAFKNIMDDGTKATSKINIPGCTPVGSGSASVIGYNPYEPTSQNDSNIDGHDYRVNIRVNDGAAEWDYTPKGFAPNYYSHGMALSGLNDIPSFAQAFSVIRTVPAKRVVAQGIGYYDLLENPVSNTNEKERKKIMFYSPDIESGIISADDIINAPSGTYELQCVVPLGFFTEVYDGNIVGKGFFTGIDMINYARIIRDKQGVAAQINPGEDPDMGIEPTIPDGYRYVAYSKWRNPSTATGTFSGQSNGNHVFDIVSAVAHTGGTSGNAGRGSFLEIEVDGNIYEFISSASLNFKDTDVKKWHEPLYIINIIQTGKDVPTQDQTEYIETGHYQKVSSIIGKSIEVDGQSLKLVDERWEDCITDLVDSGGSALATTYSTLDRFLFVENAEGIKERWVNVTFKNSSQITTILNSLTSTGSHTITNGPDTFVIKGIYVHENVDNENKFFNINFGKTEVSTITGVSLTVLNAFSDLFFLPPDSSLIKVDYDNRIPIRFFGGGSTIGEAIFSPHDRQYDINSDSINEKDLRVGMPYRVYEINPRVYLIDRVKGVNKIADKNIIYISSIRQIACMFTCESSINLPYAYNDPTFPGGFSADIFFPATHYIMRPHRWEATYDDNFVAGGGNIYDEYKTDYPGEGDTDSWQFGGFRFLAQKNIDYSHTPNFILHSSKPQIGFEEQNHFCTRIIWSAIRPVNVQDAPGVKTFPALNFFDISDDTGAIKWAWDALASEHGSNLYAFTDSGTCLLLVDKRIIHEVSGKQLATAGADGVEGILKQIWISKETGMNDEMWRSASENDNHLYFANDDSAFHFNNNALEDIGRFKYHSRVYGEALKNIRPGFVDNVAGGYDKLHNEYWLGVKRNRTEVTYANIVLLGGSIYAPPADPVVENGDVLELIQSGTTFAITAVFMPDAAGVVDEFIICSNSDNQRAIQLIDSDTNDPIMRTLNPLVELFIQSGECWKFTKQLGTQLIDRTDPANPIVIGTVNWVAEPTTTNDVGDVYVYNEIKKHWMGVYTYDFDQFLSVKNKIFGMRDLETYELNKGYLINEQAIEAFAAQASAPTQGEGKEFIRVKVNSDNKPSGVDFYSTKEQFIADDVQASLDTVSNPDHLLDYDGYAGYVPRKTDSPYDRMQGRLLIYKVKHNKQEPFKIISTGLQHKILK